MNKEKITVTRRIWLIAFLSVAFWGIVIYFIKSNFTKAKEYLPEIFAEIEYEFGEDEYIVSFEVSDDEKTVALDTHTYSVSTSKEITEENSTEVEIHTTLTRYEWNLENKTMKKLEMVEPEDEYEEMSDATQMVMESELVEMGDGVSNAYFVGEGPKILVETVNIEGLEGNAAWEVGYKLYDLSDGINSGIELDLDFFYVQEDFAVMPYIYTNIEKDRLFYLEDKTIYVVSLEMFLEKAIVKNNSETGQDKIDYKSGDYSYDAYDVGNFTSEHRNKASEEENQGIYYEIFVRSFADSDGDGIGDFNGITENLDYLDELGIEGIWLMPINASDSYHGYDVTDYTTLNSEYGTEEDFQKLLEEAHNRDMKVIMDFVINHTSSEHPWFVAALEDENSEYRNYYRWVYEDDIQDYDISDTSNWDSKVWHKYGNSYYYGIFNAYMPDLNYNNPVVREEIKEAAGKWLKMGVDGFRLDAAMHIYGANEFKQEENLTENTLTWWNEFALYCENINPDVYLVGEAWQDEEVLEEYVQPFDTKFNFAFQQNMLDAICNETAILENGENLSTYLQNILHIYDTVDNTYLDGFFGSNHDQNRIMSTVGSEEKARQVAAIYMTLPGNPYIYYGEELGMLGEKPDEMIRTPFLWGENSSYNTTWIEDEQNIWTKTLEEQIMDNTSMYSFYKELIAVRKENVALLNGDFLAVDTGNDSIMAYIRECDEQRVLIFHNLSSGEQTLSLQDYDVKDVLYSIDKNTEKELVNQKITLPGNQSILLEIE